jgi:hypothetical protein
MAESEFLPDGFFVCDVCGEIHEKANARIVPDMDGEEGDVWVLCPNCEPNNGED